MFLAIPGDDKLGQADLINSCKRLSIWVYPYSTPSKGKEFPDLPGKSVHHSTDEPELHGIENKGYPMRVHILVSMQWQHKQWLADGTLQFHEIAYKAVISCGMPYLAIRLQPDSPGIQSPVSHFCLRFGRGNT